MTLDSPTPPIIVVTGPTATGKTALSVALATHLNCDIISADSRLIYQGLDIGTAKPTLDERAGIPHHAIDVATPTTTFTAGDYQTLVQPLLDEAQAKHRSIILAGGTGFYLQSVLTKQTLPQVPPDPGFRDELSQRIQREGLAPLYQELHTKDPIRAGQLYPQDESRIIRALEIIHATGQPVPQITPQFDRYPNLLWLGLTWANRDRHRQLITDRVDAMLHDGWLDEVDGLVNLFGANAHALQVTHGYPELIDVLHKTRDLADAKTDIAQQVCQYARRQRTWFKRNPNIHWLAVDDAELPELTQQALAKLRVH